MKKIENRNKTIFISNLFTSQFFQSTSHFKMTIEIPELSDTYSSRLHEYEEMTTFVERCRKELKDVEKFKFIIQLGTAGYYEKKPGFYGWCGYTGIPEIDNKPKVERKPYPKESEVLSIYIETTVDQYRSVEEKIKAIQVTPGGHDNIHQSVVANLSYKTQISKIGLFKKEFFDEGFAVMKKIHPDITEKEFAVYGTKSPDNPYCVDDQPQHDYESNGEWKKDFTEEFPYRGEEECIMTREERSTTKDLEDIVRMNFSIMTPDIERNSDLLIEILSAL